MNPKGIVTYVDSYWIRYGVPEESDSFTGSLIGKYLFFSKNQNTLKELCEHEISEHDFKVAKVSFNANNGEYVCCLYWTGGERKHELRDRYQHRKDVKYRYWKTNADTRAGRYSKQFKQTPTTGQT